MRTIAADDTWLDRTLVALSATGPAESELVVIQEVAVRFADQFGPHDRTYIGARPSWHRAVGGALRQLQAQGAVESTPPPRLTEAGDGLVDAAKGRLEAGHNTRADQGEAPPPPRPDDEEPMLVSGVISLPLRTPGGRARANMPVDEGAPIPVMVEVNLGHELGPEAALRTLTDLWTRVTGQPGPTPLAEEYATGSLTLDEIKRLVAADAAPIAWGQRSIYKLWPDFPVRRQIDASVVTVKADAARRSFAAAGAGIVWAVIDSGIQGDHPHFVGNQTLSDPSVVGLHRMFPPAGEPTLDGALVDEDGHGTHVAGIIAGGLAGWEGAADQVVVTESRYNVDNPHEPLRQPRTLGDAKTDLAGMAPRAKLVSLKVLGAGGPLESRVSRVIAALAYVRRTNAAGDKLPRIHGVNISLGYDFDPTWFACGRSPLCQEVDKVVRTGVVVVVAAGNSGYGTVNPTLSDVSRFGMSMTINDPGNAERAITVGSTHRDMPHAYGVSYFSSKGPTGDGRRKPDVVAPGERITSAAAGRFRSAVSLPDAQKDAAVYVEATGTSMAAPHVSGIIAAFLSVRREYIGRPDEVKRIFVESATPLGRDPSFEGAGLVDLMRALQSI